MRTRDRPKDLLLEDAHVISATEDGRLDVVAAVASGVVRRAAGQDLGALGDADVYVVHDSVMLRHGDLRAHHCARIERVTELDGFCARHHLLHELLVDVLLDQ